jgi:O-antigen ligase
MGSCLIPFSKFAFRIFNRKPAFNGIGNALAGASPKSADLDQAKRYGIDNLTPIIFIVGTVFIIPFLYSDATLDPVLSIRFLAWSMLSVVIILIYIFQGSALSHSYDVTVIFRAIFPIAIGCIVVSGLSLTKSINLADGVFEWLKLFLSLTCLYLASLILGRNQASLSFLTKSVILAALIMGLIGLGQYFQIGFTEIPGNNILYGTMVNANLFASALFLMLPFILFGALQFYGGWYLLSTVTLTGVIHVIALSEARAVWGASLIFIVGMVMFILLGHPKLKFLPKEKYSYRRRSLTVIVIFLISSVGAIWSHSYSNHHFCEFSTRPLPAEIQRSEPLRRSIQILTDLKGRNRVWQKTLPMITAAPFLGVGLGQWKIVWPAYEMSQTTLVSQGVRREARKQRPHNDFLWVCAETGILGFIAHLIFWGVLIVYSFRIIGHAAEIQDKIFAAVMLFGIIGFAMISFVSFPKERIFHSLFFMLIAGGLVAIYHRTFPVPKAVKAYKILSLNFIILTILVFGLIFGYTRFKAEAHTKKTIAAFRAKDWRGVVTEIDKVNWRFYNLDPTSTPLFWYRGMANFSLGKVEEARSDFLKAHADHPYHIHVLNNLGTCDAKLLNFDTAVDYYQRALSISPRFEQAILNLAVVYFQTAKYRQAQQTLLDFTKIKPHSQAAAYLKMVEDKIDSIENYRR